MKKIFVIVAIILVIGTLASATSNLSFLKKEEKNDAPEIVSENLRMAAAPAYTTSDGYVANAMCFDVMVDPELYEEVMASQDNSFGILIAPVDYFAAVSNEVSVHGKSWHEAFEDAELDSWLEYDMQTIEERDESGKLLYYRLRYRFANVGSEDVNREFSAIGYVCTSNGDEPEYTYAVFENEATVITSARSLAYLAAEVWDIAAASGGGLPVEIEYRLGIILNQSTNLSMGLDVSDLGGYHYQVSFAPKQDSVKLSKGSFLKLTEVYAPASSVPFSQIWVSSDSSVATVSSDGLIKAIAPGTATVTLYSAGAIATVTVIVE